MRRRQNPISEGPDLRRRSPAQRKPLAIIGPTASEPKETGALWVVVDPCPLGCHFVALLRGVGQIVGQAEVRSPSQAFWLVLGWALEENDLSLEAVQRLCETAYREVKAANQALPKGDVAP